MNKSLSACGITKTLGRVKVLNNLEFKISSNETCLLLGKNGAGKSTLLRIIAGLMRPDAGHRELGRDRLKDAQCSRAISYLGHQPQLYAELTVQENLRFRLELEDKLLKIEEVLKHWELERLAEIPCSKLSKGMAARVGLAIAFASQRAFILLDEPTASLDDQGVKLLAQAIKDHADSSGILIATHDIRRVWPLATRAVFLSDGALTNQEFSGLQQEEFVNHYMEIIR